MHTGFSTALLIAVCISSAAANAADMVTIAAGTLQMGRNDGADDERPAHRVTLGAFSIDRLPVTQHGLHSSDGTEAHFILVGQHKQTGQLQTGGKAVEGLFSRGKTSVEVLSHPGQLLLTLLLQLTIK